MRATALWATGQIGQDNHSKKRDGPYHQVRKYADQDRVRLELWQDGPTEGIGPLSDGFWHNIWPRDEDNLATEEGAVRHTGKDPFPGI